MSTPIVVDVRDGSVKSRILIALGELLPNERLSALHLTQALGLSHTSKKMVYDHLRNLDDAGIVHQSKHTGINSLGGGYVRGYRLAPNVVLQTIEGAVQGLDVITEAQP